MKLSLMIKHVHYSLYKKESMVKILRFVDQINALLKSPIRKFRCAKRNTLGSKHTNPTILNEIHRGSLIQGCLEKKYSSVSFYSGDIDKIPDVYFHIDIDKDDNLHAPILWLRFDINQTDNISDKVSDSLKQLHTLLPNSLYGFIIVTDTDYHNFSSQVVWAQITKWGVELSDTEQKLQKELGFYQRNTCNLSSFIPKAYWGNFLNNKHLKGLGGIEKVKKEAPVYMIDDHSPHGAFLQLTESPMDIHTPDFKKKLISLDTYFKPIIFPQRPEVTW